MNGMQHLSRPNEAAITTTVGAVPSMERALTLLAGNGTDDAVLEVNPGAEPAWVIGDVPR